jgi:carboxyl-terminal processing protease
MENLADPDDLAACTVVTETCAMVIVAPLDDSPAQRAGLRPGDQILAVDGTPTLGESVSSLVYQVRGESGTDVTLTIRRDGEESDVTITRAVINLQEVNAELLEDGIGYIRLTSFTDRATGLFRDALTGLLEQGATGIVFDLRSNPGGYIVAAQGIASQFVTAGELLFTVESGEEVDEWRAESGVAQDPSISVIVLVDGGSASASEIVAGALQDHRRATVLGTRSFGKGSVQTIIPLGAGNGALRLTTARYYTPSGKSIQAKGIVPDIEVLQDVPEEMKARAESKGESSLRGHLKADGDEQKGSQSYIPPDQKDDKALAYALELLRGTKTNTAFPPSPRAAAAPQ